MPMHRKVRWVSVEVKDIRKIRALKTILQESAKHMK